MLKIKKSYLKMIVSNTLSNFFKNDNDGKIAINTFRVFLALILFIISSIYILHIKQQIMVWGCFYMAFAAISCNFGALYSQRKIFFIYTLFFIIAIIVASYLSYEKPIYIKISIIIVCFICFWSRGFSSLFKLFPNFIALTYVVSISQISIKHEDILTAIFILLYACVLYYIVVFIKKKWDTPYQLKKMLVSYLKILYKEVNKQNRYINSAYENNAYKKDKLKIQSQIFYDRGGKWIILKSRRLQWQKSWALISVLYTQFKIIFKNIPKLSHSEYKVYLQNHLNLLLNMMYQTIYIDNCKNSNESLINLNDKYEILNTKFINFFSNESLSDIELFLYYDILNALEKVPKIIDLLTGQINDL